MEAKFQASHHKKEETLYAALNTKKFQVDTSNMYRALLQKTNMNSIPASNINRKQPNETKLPILPIY